jgi:hypothetical protein
MGALAEAAVAKLREEREQTLRELLALSEGECRYPARWGGMDRTVNFVLRAFSLHLLDHIQHAMKLMRDRGQTLTEPQILLMKSQALMGEFETMLLALSDEEFARGGPNDGDWPAQKILEHVAETERGYREEILRAVRAGREQAASKA